MRNKPQGSQRVFTKDTKTVFEAGMKVLRHLERVCWKAHTNKPFFYELQKNGLFVEKRKALPLVYENVRY
jgi:hypothetical protein